VKRLKKQTELLYVIVLMLLMAVITSCVNESDDIDNMSRKGGPVITIEMTIPGFDLPVTRSLEEGKGEADVRSLDILIFDKNATPKLLDYSIAGNIQQSTSGPDYKVTFDIELEKLEKAGSIAVIANASEAVTQAIAVQTEKPSILNALKYNISPDKDGSYKWITTGDDFTRIPMYGEIMVEKVTAGMKLTGIQLKRMVARIDIENKVNGSIFDLEEIYLVNFETGGYITPAWNSKTGFVLTDEDEDFPYTGNLDPAIPDDNKDPGTPTEENAMKYRYAQENNAPGPLLAGEIYTFEARKGSDSEPADRVGLILKGNYRGTECYYRVDFTRREEGQQPDKIENMPLYRNYKYTVVITDAEGIGYENFDQALHSETVLSNLKTSVLVVDLAGINQIVFNGQNFLGVESRLVRVPWGMDKQLTHTVKSDYTGSWRADILNPDINTWLRFPGDQTSLSGTDISTTGIELSLTALSLRPSDDAYPSGQIVLSAGRLRDTVTVRRVAITEMFANSNVVKNSGLLTFATTEEDNLVIPAYSQGVLFKWGSLFALAPNSNPYSSVTDIVYNPNSITPEDSEDGLTRWDKIPYAHRIFNFDPPLSTEAGSDAFEDYNDIGFDEAQGIGDICRYISGKSWVEGKWRLPTYAEMEMLYQETPTSGIPGGDFKNTTNELENDQSAENQNGMFNPGSGWLIGLKANGSTVSNAEMAVPPKGTIFLPASGHRYPNGNGDIVHAGAYGYYWCATPMDGITVNYMFLNKDAAGFVDADRSYAFPVRCIRDY